MKNSRFPIPALFRHFNPSNILRAALVLGLMALVSSLPFYSFAQGDPVVTTKKSRTYSVTPDRGSFVLYQGANGETLCREATPQEARGLRGATSKGLIQINHLKDGLSAEATTAGLRINLMATPRLETNGTAKAAFVAAAAKWEALIKDPITINVEVDFGDDFFGVDPFADSTVIGATQSPQFFVDGGYPEFRQQLISHASPSELAIANALPANTVPTDLGNVDTVFLTSSMLRTLGGLAADYHNDAPGDVPFPQRIGFNSAFAFDFDPSDDITGNRTDFDAVAVHEIGHLLGFSSEVGDRELDPSATLGLTIWDLFRFRPGTANLGTFSTAQRILLSGGTQVQFNGLGEQGLSTGKPDGSGGDLNQASHWRDDLGNVSNYIGIMDPRITRNVRETMTANDQKALDAFGYNLIAAPAPPNDNFVNAQNVAGNSGFVNGNSLFSTKETGEPAYSFDGTFSGKSIWYRWTAPNNGTVTMTTAGSTFDTLLAVYTGSSVNGLTEIARDDDEIPGSIFTSRVQFSAVAGTTYQIAVDGYGSFDGSVTLSWNLPSTLPNTVQFTASTASVTEALNATRKVDLTVTRTGTTSGAATVNYATTDGTASERSDYQATLGTLRFAAGETSKTITVFIVNDSFGESPETFNITLNTSVGSNFGTPSTAVATINSDENTAGVNAPNPVKDPTFDSDLFVRQHYVDFFNREADPGGLNFWKNQIDVCTDQACRESRRINVSAAFFVSGEFQQTGYLVYKSYQAAFNSGEFLRLRDFLPDTQEIGRGVVIGAPGSDALLEANTLAFFNDFVQRASFVAPGAYPTTMTAVEFVDKLNANTFDPLNTVSGGALTPSERTNLINQLNPNPASPTLRAAVLRSVAQNSLFSSRQFNKAFVLMQYFGYMRRNPNDPPEFGLDFGGYNFWLAKLNQFNGNYIAAEMVKAFITSGEYKLRFGPD